MGDESNQQTCVHYVHCEIVKEAIIKITRYWKKIISSAGVKQMPT